MPVAIQHEAGRVRERDRLPAQPVNVLDRVLGDVAGAADQARLTPNAVAAGLEHLFGEVDAAVAGRLRPDQAAAPLEPLAGEHARELVGELLVLAEQVPDLALADADVARRHIAAIAQVAEELRHERLTEAHHLHVALALGIEVRAALARADRQCGERVLEGLLEGQELENPQVHARVEAQTALVRPDGAAHLHPEPSVDLHAAGIVDPRHAEDDHALGLYQASEDAGVAELGIAIVNRQNRVENFVHRLVEGAFPRVARDELIHEQSGAVHHQINSMSSPDGCRSYSHRRRSVTSGPRVR